MSTPPRRSERVRHQKRPDEPEHNDEMTVTQAEEEPEQEPATIISSPPRQDSLAAMLQQLVQMNQASNEIIQENQKEIKEIKLVTQKVAAVEARIESIAAELLQIKNHIQSSLNSADLHSNNNHCENAGDPAPDRSYHGNNAIAVKSLPRYDGTLDAMGFVQQCTMLAKVGNWTDEILATKMMQALTGKAQEALSCLNETQVMSGNAILDLIKKRFGCRITQTAAMGRLQNKTQGRGETLASLSQDVAKLTQLAYPEANLVTKAKLEVSAFLNAIQDEELRYELKKMAPIDLSEALSKAEELEQLTRPRGSSHVRLVTGISQNRNQSSQNHQNDNQNWTQSQCQDNNQNYARANQNSWRKPYQPQGLNQTDQNSTVTCTYCGYSGHSVAQCRKKAWQERNGNQNQANAHLNAKNPAGHGPSQQQTGSGRRQ